MFLDQINLYLKAGDGGDGLVSFRRERFIGKGGPDGGDGGRGGSIFFEVDPNLNTLAHLSHQKNIIAPSGKRGGKNKRKGKSGEDITVFVPQGTVIYDEKNGQLIADLSQSHQRLCLAKGGSGGFGNAHFATSTRQAPTFAELGEPGEERWVRLELKLIADVGIIGLPNVGKSTLLAHLSEAKPKIADYPFTTLVPNLGVVKVNNYSFVASDVPGLIKGAYQGKGLGDQFLRHIERCRLLIHLIDINSPNLLEDFRAINQELALYSRKLAKKPQIVALNKIDLLSPQVQKVKFQKIKELFAKEGLLTQPEGLFFISAVSGQGLKELLYKVVEILKKRRKSSMMRSKIPLLRPHLNLLRSFEIEKSGSVFVIKGERLEAIANKTDIQHPSSLSRLNKILESAGVFDKLKKAGIKKGNYYKIGRHQFCWLEER